MADPTIQTFCCYNDNSTNMADIVMNEFNTLSYNAICLFSSSLGIIGAIYQILPRQEFVCHHRWMSVTATRGRSIIVWLAFADLFASLGVFLRSALWINYKNIMPYVDDMPSVIYCAVSSAVIQYFYTSTWIWTLCYTIDMRLVLREKKSKLLCYHLAAWIIPAVTTTVGLLMLYMPDARCHTSGPTSIDTRRLLPNYLATYLPMMSVLILNPLLYKTSLSDMERSIMAASGQFTNRERKIMDTLAFKFSVINMVFYMCWFPNIINAILLWALWIHLPVKCIIIIWYLMALLNPLQAFFNCLVYRRWSKGSEIISLPYDKLCWKKTNLSTVLTRSHNTSSTIKEEIVPLLHSTSKSSLKDYT